MGKDMDGCDMVTEGNLVFGVGTVRNNQKPQSG
jgi:hypothetical protein